MHIRDMVCYYSNYYYYYYRYPSTSFFIFFLFPTSRRSDFSIRSRTVRRRSTDSRVRRCTELTRFLLAI